MSGPLLLKQESKEKLTKGRMYHNIWGTYLGVYLCEIFTLVIYRVSNKLQLAGGWQRKSKI